MNELLDLLANAVKFIADMIVIFGMIWIGLTLKDGAGGSQLSGGITMIVAGFTIRSVAQMVHP